LNTTYLNIHKSIKFVRGAKNNMVANLMTQTAYMCPDIFIQFTENLKNRTLEEFRSELLKEELVNFEIYLKWIFQNNFGFISKAKITNNASLDNNFKNPYLISNCIIEYSKWIESHRFTEELNSVMCQALVCFFNKEVKLQQVMSFLKELNTSTIENVDIYLPEMDILNDTILENLLDLNLRLRKIVIYNSKSERVNSLENNERIIVYCKSKPDLRKSCGSVDLEYMTVNYLSFIESISHNSCLNRKISIDKDGTIRNCPSMKESFGNIRDTTLAEAIEKPGFKKYWDINKDKIHVCKDCEFRYICTDCRAYVEDPEDILSKPLKCGYNPYTGEWSEWSTNPLKQKAIDFYGMREVI